MSGRVAHGRVQGPRISNRERRRAERRRAARQQQLLIFGAVTLIALAAIAVTVLLTRDSGDDGSSMLYPAVVAAEPLDASIPREGRILGDPNAPVTIVEWADYQCPFCGSFNNQILPRIIEDFVKTGQVKIEFRDLPFLDGASGFGESDMAAEAAASAGDQGKFWEFHDVLFANQYGENEGAYSKERLFEMAEFLGLDMEQFKASFESRAHKAEIDAMQAEAVEAGINSTPTLVINGTIVRYTGNYEDLKADIEAAIAAA